MIDFSSLALPVFEESPCGQDLREDKSFHSLYFQVKEERFSARAIERSPGEGDARPQWQKVYDLCCKILKEQSKDTQVVCWLMEAALRLKRFEGLAGSLQLAYLLVETYWEDLHPRPTEDRYEARLSPFYGLNGEETEGALIFPLLNTPLTQARTVPSFTTCQYKEAQNIEKITDLQKKEEKLSKRGISLKDIDKAIQETSQEYFKALISDLKSCIESLDKLDQALTRRCGNQAPSFLAIRETLEECFSTLKSFSSLAFEDPSSIEKAVSTESDLPSETSVRTETAFLTREQAFQELGKIAIFFKKSEPHSPLPYLLEKAVRWGKMPFQNLLQELIDDEKTLSEIFRLMGIEMEGKV